MKWLYLGVGLALVMGGCSPTLSKPVRKAGIMIGEPFCPLPVELSMAQSLTPEEVSFLANFADFLDDAWRMKCRRVGTLIYWQQGSKVIVRQNGRTAVIQILATRHDKPRDVASVDMKRETPVLAAKRAAQKVVSALRNQSTLDQTVSTSW